MESLNNLIKLDRIEEKCTGWTYVHHKSKTKGQISESSVDLRPESIYPNSVARLKSELTVKIGKFLKVHAEIPVEYLPKIRNVLARHPKWDEKSANSVGITILETGGIRMFGLIKQDGTVEEISYRKAIYGEKHANNARSALGNTIKYLQSGFQKVRHEMDRTACDYCETNPGILVTQNSPSFQYLVEGFMQTYNISVVKTYLNEHNYMRLADRNMADAWIAYYKERANLTLACRDCFTKHRFSIQ